MSIHEERRDHGFSGIPDFDPATHPLGGGEAASAASNFRFPEGFLWGASTSSHQVEGNNIHNDWWAWERAGRTAESSGPACDHFNRYREDFDLAQAIGHNAHRFSIAGFSQPPFSAIHWGSV